MNNLDTITQLSRYSFMGESSKCSKMSMLRIEIELMFITQLCHCFPLLCFSNISYYFHFFTCSLHLDLLNIILLTTVLSDIIISHTVHQLKPVRSLRNSWLEASFEIIIILHSSAIKESCKYCKGVAHSYPLVFQ